MEGTERLVPISWPSARRHVAATRPAWRVLKGSCIISCSSHPTRCCSDSTRMEGTESGTREQLHERSRGVAATRPAWRVLKDWLDYQVLRSNTTVAATRPAWRVLKVYSLLTAVLEDQSLQRLDPHGGY